MTPRTSRGLHLATVLAALLGVVGTSAACTPLLQQQHAARPGSSHTEPYMRTQLFFGTGRHNGAPPITEEQFMDFLDTYITPRFPAGLTLQEGHGQWRDKTGSINSERSYELILLYPRETARARDADIEYIRKRYTEMYDLESVGRVDEEVQADF
ncbi:MAG TPA: DUF3574 domain-containing protein [Streptomyces sp.]|uniref:DUF3574 domain-containing protein n=1 Tax=Streptomyces sp. TaxID=1931 RepID=UPI002D6F2DA3|nr:DUF3574 domain-containing protein [Streptomyces sp.]HZG06322.1 DUF3574 domain-containing protein [Streptomyces sp.]